MVIFNSYVSLPEGISARRFREGKRRCLSLGTAMASNGEVVMSWRKKRAREIGEDIMIYTYSIKLIDTYVDIYFRLVYDDGIGFFKKETFNLQKSKFEP